MTVDVVPADEIEAIVGATRQRHEHLGRLVDGRVYILHSQQCVDRHPDLRDCPFSIALDSGLAPEEQEEIEAAARGGAAVRLMTAGYSIARGGNEEPASLRIIVGEQHHETPAHVRALHDATHRIRSGRAVCDGTASHSCHWWPDTDVCAHEQFPCGHPYVFHDECWIIQWINAADLEDSALNTDAWDVETGEWPDGPILWEWDGEGVLWWYDTARADLLAAGDAAHAAVQAATS